jgi:hypothetical protein
MILAQQALFLRPRNEEPVAELKTHFAITSIGTVMVFGGMQAFWSQAW